jgi:pilus assembly protein Flp/PilA
MKPRLVSWMVQFLRDEEGPTVVDYLLILALIIVVCLAAITLIGQQASQQWATP